MAEIIKKKMKKIVWEAKPSYKKSKKHIKEKKEKKIDVSIYILYKGVI